MIGHRSLTAWICGFPGLKSETWGTPIHGEDDEIIRSQYYCLKSAKGRWSAIPIFTIRL
jgi:hypothetical protein